MPCKCKIDNKKLQPSPYLKSYVPGENVRFREVNSRVTEINVVNGGVDSQHIFVDTCEPEKIKADDFLMKVSEPSISLTVGSSDEGVGFFCIFDPILTEEDIEEINVQLSAFIDGIQYPIAFDDDHCIIPFYQIDLDEENYDALNVPSSELYIGCTFIILLLNDSELYSIPGQHSIYFERSGVRSNTVTFTIPEYPQATDQD